MDHTLQDRYSAMVEAKLRSILVTKDNKVFNTTFEGNPKAGAVKVPVRDTEATAGAYNKASGIATSVGTTTYETITIDNDVAVNEIIDGYDAAALPDNVIADRLDSAAYSLASAIEADAITELETNGTVVGTAVLTKTTVYAAIIAARTALSNAKVPTMDRWMLVSPDVYGLLLQDSNFVRSTALGDNAVANGIVGRIAGFDVYECTGLNAKTNFIVGHPDWCARVQEFTVPVHVQSMECSGKFIGASAVQGRNAFAHKVLKAAAVQIHKNAA